MQMGIKQPKTNPTKAKRVVIKHTGSIYTNNLKRVVCLIEDEGLVAARSYADRVRQSYLSLNIYL
jgi:hypothetical protein